MRCRSARDGLRGVGLLAATWNDRTAASTRAADVALTSVPDVLAGDRAGGELAAGGERATGEEAENLRCAYACQLVCRGVTGATGWPRL